MIKALLLLVGAMVFFGGFIIGYSYTPIKPQKQKNSACKPGSVVFDKEYHDFLNFDGTINE